MAVRGTGFGVRYGGFRGTEVFAARLRQDLSVQQVMRGVGDSSLATTSTVASAVQSSAIPAGFDHPGTRI